MSMMTQLYALRAARDDTLAALFGMDPARLAFVLPWRNEGLTVRFYLLRLAERDDERRIALDRALAAAGWVQAEGQAMLGNTVAARGRVVAALVGVPDTL